MKHYELIDSGEGRKLERFGQVILSRPCSQAVWRKNLSKKEWDQAQAVFFREEGNQWEGRENLPNSWEMELEGVTLKLSATDFGHVGVFPEHALLWKFVREQIQKKGKGRILNLFAYSGGLTAACLQGGGEVTHVDASKGMVQWASENVKLNKLQQNSVRWIVDDALKFIKREARRGSFYDGIILDPPTFGRGAKKEIFKIERDIVDLLDTAISLLTPNPLFFIFSCHTPGFSPMVMEHLLCQAIKRKEGKVETGELYLPGSFPVPSGTFARWAS